MENEINRDNKPKETSEAEANRKRWYCVSISPSGVIFKQEAETPAGFLDIVTNASVSWVDYVVNEADFHKAARNAALQMGFSEDLISSFTESSYLKYRDSDTELGMKISAVQVREFNVEPHPYLLFMKKNFIFTVHPIYVDRRFTRLKRYSETVLKKLPAGIPTPDRMTLLLIRIVHESNDSNFEHLRQIEEQGDKLNESMTDPYTPRTKLGPEIYRMKHAVITYLNALWDTVDVLHTLRYGDADLITDDDKILEKLSSLVEDVNRQIGLAEHMSEVLSSGLEVLQSIYNNQLQNLNNRLALLMTYLTIIGTAVLVPNTLATMLGNGVFEIGPHDMWWYIILMVGSTALATFGVYLWVKKQGWLPKKMD
ncbi:MAG: CorA family divalent cation transporter [Dehalococcoidales bacterium]|nr:CorA family divalent cation transporter [Dehalococcoidales bacterium]